MDFVEELKSRITGDHLGSEGRIIWHTNMITGFLRAR